MLELLVPNPRLAEIDEVVVAATPDRTWDALHSGDLGPSWWIRALFALRTLPDRARGNAPALRLRLDELRSSREEPGFQVLGRRAPSEIVVGAIGKVWKLRIPFVHVDGPAPFAEFGEPGFVKVAWALRVEPATEGCSRVALEVRVDATDEQSWRRFRRYFVLIGPASRCIRRSVLSALVAKLGHPPRSRDHHGLPHVRARDVLESLGGALLMVLSLVTPFLRAPRSHWGLTPELARRDYPGDELVRAPRWSWTHAIEVDASAERVWPWVAQVGADRAGFYSYEWLENLAGCKIHNAETIRADWEHRAGDDLVLHPAVPPLRIVASERGRYLTAHARADERARAAGRRWVEVTWSFQVEPLARERCRVISRYRVACSNEIRTRLAFGPLLAEPIGFVMDRRMLRGIKARGERSVERV